MIKFINLIQYQHKKILVVVCYPVSEFFYIEVSFVIFNFISVQLFM